jgi:uncharacterized protein (DUF58 family)
MSNSPRPLVPSPLASRASSFGRISFAFGPRFFVALLFGFLWLVPAWWAPRLIAAMFLWDVLISFAFLADLLRLPKPEQFELTRSWKHPPSLATLSQVTLAVRNLSGSPVRGDLVDETPASLRSTPPSLSLVVPSAQPVSASYPILPRERGEIRLGRLFFRYQSKLAFAERWAVADLSQTVCILPDLEQARRQALYLIRSRQVEMEKRRRRQRGIGREFESLREYRPGDDARDICWTATARRHQLTTRLFEVERSQAVWIMLDAGRLLRAEIYREDSNLRLAKLDYAVNAALSLAQVATQCGDRVGLLAYGRTIQQNVAAGRGPAHLRLLVDCLARVRAESSEADHTRAARVLLTEQSRRSMVVWITDFAETPTIPEVIEHALQMTRRHLVLFAAINQPDLTALAARIPETPAEMYRHAAAVEIAHRRDLLLRSLRHRGVFACELVPGLLASSIVNQYLDIKERSLL